MNAHEILTRAAAITFYAIAAMDLPYGEKLDRYAALADERFETAKFRDFCDEHLGHLEIVVREFFGTPDAKDAVRKKVTALFPEHEVEKFTELFWDRIQVWRKSAKGASLPPPPVR